jgi:RNA polymerase sigma factor (sigma-70 family)
MSVCLNTAADETFDIRQRGATRLEQRGDSPDMIGVMDREDFAKLIVAVASRQDREAFGLLFDHFAPRINAFFLRSGMEPATADDVTQVVMLKLWRRADLFDPEKSSPATWLFQIARNARVDHLRRQRNEAPLGDEALSLPDLTPPPDSLLDSAQWEERVRAALATLPAEQLAIIQLAYFDGLTHRDIARQTGLPLGTVKARIRLALARLRRSL